MSKTPASAPETGVEPATAPANSEKGDLATAVRKSAGKGIWMGTAVGIGSAAIVAALLYTRKRS